MGPWYREAPMRWLGRAARIAAVTSLTGLGGCAAEGMIPNPLPSYSKSADRPSNLIEKALADCKEKTGEQETKCVKTAMADHHVTVAGLISMIPNCQADRVCLYRHTTHDSLGFLQAYAADFTVRWEVSFDLRHPGSDASQVPITVKDVDAYPAR